MRLMRWLPTLFCTLTWMACTASTIEYGDGAGGQAGDGQGQGAGEGDGGAEPGNCGGNTCGQFEICYASCDPGGQSECGHANITCGEHDMGGCGCDGNAYATLCEMNEAGIREGVEGSCTPPAGQYACGAMLCRVADQVCTWLADSPYCHARDAACSDCSCIDVTDFCSSGGSCEDVPGGGVSVACQ